MKNIKGLFLISCLLATIIIVSAGCAVVEGEPATTTTTTTSITTTTTQNQTANIVLDFINNSATFRFDGIAGSLKILNVKNLDDGSLEYTVEYQNRQAGHGDRTGEMLAQVITVHTAIIDVKDGKIVSAICDGVWDLQHDIRAVKVNQEFVLPIGQSIILTEENMAIKFDEVTQDCRAPKGVESLWVGVAKCRMQITIGGVTSTLILAENGSMVGYSQATFNQFTIYFQLLPYPEAGKQTVQSDYTLLMKITR